MPSPGHPAAAASPCAAVRPTNHQVVLSYLEDPAVDLAPLEGRPGPFSAAMFAQPLPLLLLLLLSLLLPSLLLLS